MSTKQCKSCHTLFNAIQDEDLCVVCLEEEHKKYLEIRSYLYDHPGANIIQINEALGIEAHIIVKLVDAGRIEILGSSEQLRCQTCGIVISYGVHCEKCAVKQQKKSVFHSK